MENKDTNPEVFPDHIVLSKIFIIRDHKVMIDRDSAELYGVETRTLNQAVKRNLQRFPEDFMFQMTSDELENWKSQIVISNKEKMGIRKPPLVFTEQGVAMLGSDSLFLRIREILDKARNKVYRTANTEMLSAYWNVGKEIMEEEQKGKDRAAYGSALIKGLSIKLTKEYGRGFTETNLKYMRQFYQTFEKGHALRDELTWTHYRLLLKVEKEDAKEFYIKEAITGNWSTRQLERQINTLYFERLILSKDKKGLMLKTDKSKEATQPGNIIKDPFMLEFLDMKENEKLAESNLESALIDKLQHFILELGNGFSFVGRQYRITVDNDHFYIDLVFYNYILKCFLLIDLKADKLTHKDIGQMDFYVRFFEDQLKQPGDNPSIGLILCAERNKTIVKYSLLNESKQIFASKYQLYLPTVKQLEHEIQREREQIEQEKKLSGK